MKTRELDGSPGMLGLYARAALPLIPGASMLPFLGGSGREIPQLELRLSDVHSDPDRLAAYARVCGFTLRNQLPATYPHVLAFPLHMALMTDPAFPFAAVGLVHIENRIDQHEPIDLDQPLDLHVRATPLESHPKGRSFSILTDALVDGRVVWSESSTMLRRGSSSATNSEDSKAPSDEARPRTPAPESGDSASQWRLPGDLGRRYAAVSGDRNPIHMHALSAKLFGFPAAIAHGMWSLARCLAALEGPLPGTFTAEVRFGAPILLPATVGFSETATSDGIEIRLASNHGAKTHLSGILKTKESER
jgi:acyl dehydratase